MHRTAAVCAVRSLLDLAKERCASSDASTSRTAGPGGAPRSRSQITIMKRPNSGWLSAGLVALAALVAACGMPYDQRLLDDRLEQMRAPTPRLRQGGGSATGDASSTEPPVARDVQGAADLDLYVRYALHHNAGLRAAYERFLAGVERVAQAGSLPDPQFTFAQFVEELQTRTGPQQRRYALTQAFPWFGELDLRSDVARGQAEELWQMVVQHRLEVERDVAVHFAEYAYLSRAIRITGDVLELLRQLEAVLQERVVAGRATQADLLRLQVEIGRVENDLESRRRVRPSLSARLAASMNWRGGSLPLPELAEPRLAASDTEAAIQRAFEQSPRLRLLAERARTFSDRRRLAELDAWPDFQIGVDYLETGDALMSTPGSGDDPWAVRIGFTLPIWRGRYAAARREAERGLRAVMAEHEDLRG
ncbi:MAG: TolC family protein, partial [Planctomycetes bacterium]|nr:TolC family protein [Planctomycetota bacterium]